MEQRNKDSGFKDLTGGSNMIQQFDDVITLKLAEILRML